MGIYHVDVDALYCVSRAGEGGTLMPRIPQEEGQHRLTVRVERIGLKDAADYMNGYITVSVKGIFCNPSPCIWLHACSSILLTIS